MNYYKVYYKLSHPAPNLNVGGDEFHALIASSQMALISQVDVDDAYLAKTKSLGHVPIWWLGDAIQFACTRKYGVKAKYITGSDMQPVDIHGNPIS